jgi:ribosome-associated protein
MSEDLFVQPGVRIPAQELQVKVCRSSGPGGQHVNTSNTKVQLLWAPLTSVALSDEQRERLCQRLERRISNEGLITCSAEQHRSQRKNLELARERLAELIRKALFVQRARKATKPSRSQRAKRLKAKKERGQLKAQRSAKSWD